MKKKVTYIISDLNRAIAFEWIAAYIDKEKIDLSFIILNPADSILEQHLRANNIPVTHIRLRGKKDWPIVWLKLRKYLKQTKPDIIHCHLQQASILGLSAGRRANIPARIHTRHHSSLHHVFFPKGVYWDKFVNRLSTHIVAISNQVRHILIDWEKVPESKVKLIPHGFLLNELEHVDANKVAALKEKYGLTNVWPVVGVISRFTEWKGVQYIIPAFEQVLQQYHDAVLLLFNAGGDYEATIKSLLARLPESSYRLIPFEPDIIAAYHLMDVCVHVPIDEHSEAFGQVYIEALAAGVPLVASQSGIGCDILEHQKNAWVVPHKDNEAIAEGIKAVVSDKVLKDRMIANGRQTAQQFSLQHMIQNLEELYEQA